MIWTDFLEEANGSDLRKARVSCDMRNLLLTC